MVVSCTHVVAIIFICFSIFRQLSSARDTFTAASLNMLANYRKRQQLVSLMKSLRTIKTLVNIHWMEFVYKKWAWHWIFAYQRIFFFYLSPLFSAKNRCETKRINGGTVIAFLWCFNKNKVIRGWDIIEGIFFYNALLEDYGLLLCISQSVCHSMDLKKNSLLIFQEPSMSCLASNFILKVVLP